jgi:predicted MFS family arabinose efflux permease
MVSDHLGRKPVITLGLIIFIIGSLVAAFSTSIYSMMIGRALQGAGAVGSTIIAMIADLTRETQRTKAMAINGMTIGVSFSLAMMLGPVLATWVSVSGIFGLAALLATIALIILYVSVPTPEKTSWHSDAEPEPAQFMTMLKEPLLARLNSGVLLLHAIFTASFIAIPVSLQKLAGISSDHLWMLYVPALLIAFFFSVLMIVIAEKRHQVKSYFLFGILLLMCAELCLATLAHSVLLSAFGVLVFFTAFSLLEAFLPSYVSRAAPKTRKGTAMGIYSCAQFLGIFMGGTLGGWLYGVFGLVSVYLFCALLAVLWLALAFSMKNPQYSVTSSPAMGTSQ